MNKTLAALGMALPMSLSMVSNATADAVNDGFYVTGFVGASSLEHSLQRNTGSNTTPSITTQARETDTGYGLGLGYKLHVANDIFVGAEAFYSSEDTKTTNINNLLQTEVTLESTYGFRLLAGFDITPKASVYGFGGSTVLDFDLRNSYPFAPPVRTASEKESAFTFGVGLAYAVTKNVSVTAEYAQINDVKFDPIPEVAVPGKINRNELDLSTWKLGLAYNF